MRSPPQPFPPASLHDGRRMHKLFPITSGQNPKIKQLLRLRDKRAREQEQCFLIEGYREILRAAEAGYPIDQLFVCESLFLGSNEHKLIHEVGKYAALYELSEPLFRKCSYRDRPDGLLAVAPTRRVHLRQFQEEVKARAAGKPLFLLVAEAIEKPGNLGSILRSCDAAAVHGVIVCAPRADIFNPNVVRASIGTLFTVPLVECTFQEALALLKQEQVSFVAATPHATELFTETDFTRSIAIAMGSEQLGLSQAAMVAADKKVKIPMLGIADSLNVAAATTLLLYEVVRQRGTS